MKKKAKKSKGKDRVQVVKDKITQENERHKEKMSKLNRKLAELTDPLGHPAPPPRLGVDRRGHSTALNILLFAALRSGVAVAEALGREAQGADQGAESGDEVAVRETAKAPEESLKIATKPGGNRASRTP